MRASATSRPARDCALALALLTIVPVRASWPPDERPDVAGYFPLAGFVVGAATVATYVVFDAVDAPALPGIPSLSLVFAAVVLALGSWLTRLLHWDGLADVTDAYWGADEPERRLDIMNDPHVGAFGTVGVVLFALLQLAALALLAESGQVTALLVAPVVGRYAAVFGCWFGVPARAEGLGASCAGPPRPASLFAAVVLLGTIGWSAWTIGTSALVATALGVLLALGVPHVLARRFGGITGDVLGASVLVTETLMLTMLALVR